MASFSFKKDSLRFDGVDYTLLKTQMECHLQYIGEDYRKITRNVYNAPQNGSTTLDEIKEAELNIRDKEALLSALSNYERTNVMDLQTAHYIQNNLETLYEGDNHVKVAKLQSLKGKYEILKMGKDENITSFMQKVNELVWSTRRI